MKKLSIVLSLLALVCCSSCNNDETTSAAAMAPAATATGGGQENVKDDMSAKDIVKVAVGSKDHTTLVAALKQADLVTSLSNAGPFTVFAPTDEAFAKLPAGTVDGLMKPEQKDALVNILQYHVAVSVIKAESLTDGQVLGMVNGDNVTVHVKDGKITLNNGAAIVGSVQASNGIIHIIDGVLLPPAAEKK
ncbi:MAG: fasciclin domain-containing protein [Bacteroidota bacterium]|nr:fasciclin domain-containing protein [Bacteroidota bacterium]